MKLFDCPNCRTTLEVAKGLTECPVCLTDVRRHVAQARQNSSESTVVPESEEDDFEIVDSATEPPVASTDATIIVPQPSSPLSGSGNQTLKASELTSRQGEPDQGELDPRSTLIAPPQPDAPRTIINPVAAQEAAEIYSKGLNTVIPPRTISREDSPRQIQDYKVEKRLGKGAFGVVFRAMQVPLDRSVAVKVLTDSEDMPEERRLKMKNEFLREAQFTGRLEHPNIVPVHDIGLTVNESGKANPFYVMKEVKGKSWLDTIRDDSRRENLKIFKSVLNAVAYAHDRNILHCDLKPDNVMVGQFGEVLVVDWGQAIDLSAPETIRPGGTPAYISPEMARYWCDLHLDHKPHSESREKVGFRSDVYLLGALLFEIVAKSPPHCGEKDETAYQIIRRAAKNEVVDHQQHSDDELMQIALAALRLGDRTPIETVEGLSNAVKIYEDRLSSIELRSRAYEVLDLAKTNSDYDGFQRARFGFEESLEKWDGNTLAREGLRDARLSSARLALKDENFDLGIGILEEPETDDETNVKNELIANKTKRDRRKKLVRYLALGLAASILVGLGLNAFMINENFKSLGLRDAAVAERKQAEESTAIAVKERQRAEQELVPLQNEIVDKQKEIEQFPAKLQKAEEEYEIELGVQQKKQKEKHDQQLVAEKKEFDTKLKGEKDKHDLELADEKEKHGNQLEKEKQQYAEQLDKEKEQYAEKLDKEKLKYEEETQTLVKQKDKLDQQVSDLNESSKLLRYKSGITNVVQKLQAGDYRETRRLLDGIEGQSNWEVARLNLLAHREIEAIYPQQTMKTFAASADGSRLAMVFDQQIELRETRQFNKPLPSISVQGATAAALSPDGSLIAIAKPSDSLLKPGTIWIVDISNPNSPRKQETLRGPSRTISKLEFSRDSSRFLAVGLPSKLRKSSGTLMEKELMIWDGNWSPIEVELVGEAGQLPKFSSATFSDNGERILTTNPNGLARDQVVHVFQERRNTYRWSATSPSSGINVATFENSAATRIVGCQRDTQSGTHSLVTWSIAGSNAETSPGFVSTSSGAPSVRSVAPLEQKALSINRYDNQLVTSGQDRQITIWDWRSKTPTSFGGHAQDVEFTALLPGNDSKTNIWISVASGEKPEILKTDLAKFENEIETVQMGRAGLSDTPSPSTFGFSRVTQQLALGNDLGQASVTRNIGTQKSQTIQWDVSAWKNHVLSSEFLFAQSRGDFVYKFNRSTGVLDRVLTQIGSAFKNEIIKFEVSQDGRTALIVTNDTKPEFHLWDLQNDSKLRTIDYGAQNLFRTGSEKELLALKLSPDGRFVIGGKVGLFAWSTETGQQRQITKPGPEMARSPVSSIEFINQSSRFLVSWKDRIDRFDLNNAGAGERFNTQDVAYSKNESNLLGATEVDGRTLVLVRSIAKSNRNSGIALLELDSQTTIARFDSARFASFSRPGSADVLIVSKPKSKLSESLLGDQQDNSSSVIKKWNASTKRLETIDIGDTLQDHFDNRFRTVEKAYESNGGITLQVSNRNRTNSTRRDWNTVSIKPDMTIGPLRIIAEPKLEFHGTAGNRAISLDSGTVRFWQLSETSVQPDGVLDGFFHNCTLSNDEKTLVVIPYQSNRVIAIDPQSGEELYRIDTTGDSNVLSAALSIDSSQIAIGMESGSVELWEIGVGGETKLQKELDVDDSPIDHVGFSDNGNSLLALASQSGRTTVLHRNQDRWQQVKLGRIDGQYIVAADVSADGSRVVTGSQEGRLTIWNSEISKVAQANEASQTNEERELYNLQNKHQSEISFVKFLLDQSGESKIVSADVSSGENSYLIWKTKQSKR